MSVVSDDRMTNAAGRIGFVGLGAMGLPMALNLVRAGYTVKGFDLNPVALKSLGGAGGEAVPSAEAVAAGADMLVLMVVNAAQINAVLFEDGALAALPEGSTVIGMATCSPGAVAAIAAKVVAAGRRYIDAPVSGGVAGATAGSLTIMAAAAEPDFQGAAPMLNVLGGKVVHVGTQPGQGSVVKTVNQLLCGVHIAVAAEAFALAAKVGVDAEVLLDILGGSAASSWMLRDRGPRMLQADPPVASAIDIFIKDLGIVLEAGRDARAALPLAALAHQMFLAAAGHGLGRADDSQVIRAYEALNGM